MNQLSITGAWNESLAFVKQEARLLFPVAFLLIALPGALLQLFMPAAAPGARPEAGAWLIILPFAIVASLIGTLAICFLALRPGASVGEALQVAARRFPILLGAALIIGLGAMIALLPLLVIGGAGAAGAGAGAGLVVALLALVVLLLLVFLWIRLMLMTAVAAVEPVGPVAVLKRSWTLTRGHFWRLLGFVLLILLAAVVLMGAISAVAGILVMLLAGPPEPESLSMVLMLIVSALLQSVFSALFATLTARIYAQLAGPGASVFD